MLLHLRAPHNPQQNFSSIDATIKDLFDELLISRILKINTCDIIDCN